MIQLSPALRTALDATANRPVDLYELYLESGTRYYATEDITWGGHHYLPYVTGRSAIKRFDGGEFDRVSVTLANVDTAIAEILTTEEIEGRRLIIRKIDRSVTDDSLVLFSGVMERASKIDEMSATITATQLIGSIEHECPSRTFSQFCPWKFKGEDCGYAGAATECNKSWARCSELGNTNRFGGFRFIPHSGTYQYEVEESSRSLFLLLWKRKKRKTITATFNSSDDTTYDVPIPIILGRAQITGVNIQHADAGGELKALAAMCIGTIDRYAYCRANGEPVADWTGHHGQDGGTATQLVDPRFPASYPYHRVAYVGVSLPSDAQSEDGAPTIDAVVIGSVVDFYNAAGIYTGFSWTDNPAWCVHHFMTLSLAQGGMGIPVEEFDHAVLLETAAYCDELVADSTNDQKIYEPTSAPEDVVVGENYQRFRSTGVVGQDPGVDGPYEEYGPGNDDTSTTPPTVMVKRFTMNCAIAKAEKAVDILFKKLLPSFRGYITFSKTGKIQIRCERPVANTAVTIGSAQGSNTINVAASTFAVGDKVLVGALTVHAEVLTVAAAGTALQFTTQTQFPHDAGETIHKVEMAFGDANIVGGFEYPLSDRQPSSNRISIQYVDAPAGFEQRCLQINDYEHQERVHKINNEDVDGGAIDNYFQAWRIGQWLRAKARDLGKFCSFKADIKASALEVGDVIAVSAGETGLQAVPFRVIELGFEENDEVSVVGQVYNLGIYSDSAPQATVTVPSIYTPVLPIGELPIAEVTPLTSVAEHTEDRRVRITVTGPAPEDANFAGCETFVEIPQENDPDPQHPTLPGQLYPQGWHFGEPSTASEPKLWMAKLDLPFPPDSYLMSLAEPKITWLVYALPRSWGFSNRLIRVTGLALENNEPLTPANHAPVAVVTMDFEAYLSSMEDDLLKSVSLFESPRVTAIAEGIQIEQDYAPPYSGPPEALTIGTFEGVSVVWETAEGKVSKAEQQPYTASPYVPGSNIETARVVIPKPEVLPATIYLHLMSYSPTARQRFKRVVNQGVPTVHSQYAIATVTITEAETVAAVVSDFSVVFDGWHSNGAGVRLGKLDATWTKLAGEKIYGLYSYEGAQPPVSPALWRPTDVNVPDPPVTFWIDPITTAKRIYYCLVYQSKSGVLLPADFGAQLPIAYVDLTPPSGLDTTYFDQTPPPAPTTVTGTLSLTSGVDSYSLEVAWQPGSPTGTLVAHEWLVQFYKDNLLTEPDGAPTTGYTAGANGVAASVFFPRRPIGPRWARPSVRGVSPAGIRSAWVPAAAAVYVPIMELPPSPDSNTSTLITLTAGERGGTPGYYFRLIPNGPADKTRVVKYLGFAQWFSDAAGTVKDGEPMFLGAWEPDKLYHETGDWDLDLVSYVKLGIATEDQDGKLSNFTWSTVKTVPASTGINLGYVDPSSIDSSLQKSGGAVGVAWQGITGLHVGSGVIGQTHIDRLTSNKVRFTQADIDSAAILDAFIYNLSFNKLTGSGTANLTGDFTLQGPYGYGLQFTASTGDVLIHQLSAQVANVSMQVATVSLNVNSGAFTAGSSQIVCGRPVWLQNGLTSPLGLAYGGTGANSALLARQSLGLALPLAVSSGGTGANTAAEARTNLEAAAAVHGHAWSAITEKPSTFPPDPHYQYASTVLYTSYSQTDVWGALDNLFSRVAALEG